jgi:hypothetical protein
MLLKDTINETIKTELLKQLGNPTCYYQAWLKEDGWYLEECEIKSLDFEKKLTGGFMLKINGSYVYESDFMFDKEKAQKYVNEQNKEFFAKEIKKNKEFLETIDEKIIRQKAEAKAKIEIAEKRLAKLEE